MTKKYIVAIRNIAFFFLILIFYLSATAQNICITQNECELQDFFVRKNNIYVALNENYFDIRKGIFLVFNIKSGHTKVFKRFEKKILLMVVQDLFLLTDNKFLFLVRENDTIAKQKIDFRPSKALRKDNNLFVAGFDNDFTLKIIKTDLYLNIEAEKNFDGNFYSKIYDLKSGQDGFLLCGMLRKNYFLFEFDYELNVVWRNQGNSSRPSAYTSVCYTSDGGIVACGYSYPTLLPYSDIQLIKFDKNRKLQWSKHYGFEDEDKAKDVVEMPDGYCLTGYTKIDGVRNVFVMKTDKNGKLLNTKIFPSKNDETGEKIFRMRKDLKIIYYTSALGESGRYPKLYSFICN